MIQIARNYKTVGLAAMTIGLCFASYMLAGRTTSADTGRYQKGLATSHKNLSNGSPHKASDSAEKAVQLSEKAVGSSTYTRALVADAVARVHSNGDPKADVHLQILLAMQNQKMIEQNDRIIALLERQATDKSK